MRYIVETEKSPQQAAEDLEAAVKRNDFGVLHIHDLKQTLKKKGFELPNECRIFEICNPKQALEVLTDDMGMNLALPCRISVYEEGGRTKIGMVKPTALLAALSQSRKLMAVAEEVERKTIQIIEETK
jgi:uncharacterized protein (DUF302 family)